MVYNFKNKIAVADERVVGKVALGVQLRHRLHLSNEISSSAREADLSDKNNIQSFLSDHSTALDNNETSNSLSALHT